MGFDIISIGAPLVEIMRKDIDCDFSRPGTFLGPFPSGDTPIFINAAAKLGNKCGFIGVVGKDGFGNCFINKLSNSGVDISQIKCADNATTAVTFIAYFHDGSRRFLYHLHNAAAGLLSPDDVDQAYFKDAKWVHITGFALSSSLSSRKAVLKILEVIPDTTKVSFDPNIRKEALGADELRKIAAPVLERACIVLPSAQEGRDFMNVGSDGEACRLLQKKDKLVVQKLGDKGCKIYHNEDTLEIPAFKVDAVDPTGAGDTFCAAFLTGLIRGWPMYDTGLFANAAAALSTTKWGPMEGAPTIEEVFDLITSQKKANKAGRKS